ncbi:MAG: hypothetical protein QGG36_25120 [Pirellulaceae bacterium]|nr:hypothetical protein [Pirellulaceae bacterium]MDP7019103.1 hypothetical protein [Pirellulaceae bacterium]
MIGLFLGAMVGCGGANQPAAPLPLPPSAAPPTAAPVETVRVSVSDEDVGGAMPPLDDGRIQLAPPDGWRARPRKTGFVVRFYFNANLTVPRIHVTAEDAAFAEPEVTEENLHGFVTHVAERLEGEGAPLVEPVIPMVVGETPCARYVKKLRIRLTSAEGEQSLTVERQILETVIASRRYTIDLQTPLGKIPEFRQAGYAVAASLASAEPSGDSGGAEATDGDDGDSP